MAQSLVGEYKQSSGGTVQKQGENWWHNLLRWNDFVWIPVSNSEPSPLNASLQPLSKSGQVNSCGQSKDSGTQQAQFPSSLHITFVFL